MRLFTTNALDSFKTPKANSPSMEDNLVRWRDILTEMESRFAAAEVSHPRLSARRIAEQAGALSSVELELSLDEPLTERMMAAVDSMIARRLTHEPLQYVVGSWGFRTLDVMVDKRVLIPRPETEEVVGWALEEVDRLADVDGFAQRRIPVVDLGTGSGVIGLAMVDERPNTEITLVDRDEEALKVATANTAGLGRSATRVVNIFAGSWFEPLPVSMKGGFGIVVSNPPYVGNDEQLPPEVDDWEPRQALRARGAGTEHVRHIIENSPSWLCEAGALVVEMAPGQTDEAAVVAESYFAEVEVLVDMFQRPRAIRARFKKSAT